MAKVRYVLYDDPVDGYPKAYARAAAPFKRNDQMLDILPIGVMVFAGTGIQEKLCDKARKLSIPVGKF